jgi:hypothetical protein
VCSLASGEPSPRDDRLGAPRVAIIRYGFWQRRFGGSNDIVQRRIPLDGVDCAIIGVMPRGFGYPTGESDVCVPIVPLLARTWRPTAPGITFTLSLAREMASPSDSLRLR